MRTGAEDRINKKEEKNQDEKGQKRGSGKKKAIALGTVLLFLLTITLLPGAWYLLPEETRESTAENRELAAFPKLQSLSDILHFPTGFEDWYTDHLPWKESLVGIKSGVERSVFRQLDSDQVLLGTEAPWLFYRKKDGEQIENYKRTSAFTEEELQKIAAGLTDLRDELLGEGIGFVLLIVPDKETVYAEYMPRYVKTFQDRPRRTEVLISYLEAYDGTLDVIYPKEELLARKETVKDEQGLPIPIYYESDTHWNRIGAKTGADTLFSRLSKQDPEWKNAILNLGFTETAYEGISGFMAGDHLWNEGDLQKLCGLPSDYNSRDPYPERLPLMEVENEVAAPGGEIIYQHCYSQNAEAAKRKLYFAGDSFRWHMVQYLQEGAAESIICSRYYLDLADVKAEKPDVFVYELPERYLADLCGIVETI